MDESICFELCRVCLKDKGTVSLFTRLNNIIISDFLNSFSSIQIEKDDGYPKTICNECLQIVTIMINFKNRCDLSRSIFEGFFVIIKTEYIIADEDNSILTLLEPKNKINNGNINDDINSETDANENDANVKNDTEIKTENDDDKDDYEKEDNENQIIEKECYKESNTENITLINNKRQPRKKSKVKFDVKRHECSICYKKFTSSSNLNRHFIIHSDVKRHECSICYKHFTRMSNLKKHLMAHSGVKRHKCSMCYKKFTWSSGLKRHLIVHSGEKQHKCSICDYKSLRSWDLKSHLLVHSGEKLHKCSICNYQCLWFSNLKRHLLTHS